LGNKKATRRWLFKASKRITWLRMRQQREQLRVQKLQQREQEQLQVREQVQELLLSYRKQQGQRQQ
jgi:hypothetical protein